MRSSAIIGILTDFGNRDSYVAQMKGVIHSRCEATVVDLSHEIDPFDVFAAGIFLREVAPYFEPIVRRPVVLVAVVDPGVGSSRRILAATSRSRTFVAPDNGILSVVLGDDASVVSVEEERYFLSDGSRTFHGRDRFAPVAAALARGVSIQDLGSRVSLGEIVDLGYVPPNYSEPDVEGTVVRVDRFGNVVTDLLPDRLGSYEAIRLGKTLVVDRAETYAERVGTDAPFVIKGSMGTLEISIANGNAAKQLGIAVRDPVTASR